MKEIQRTDRLVISIIIFLLILVIGFLTTREPEISYTRDIRESAEDVARSKAFITPEELASLQAGGAPVVCADIRSIYEYDKGHLPGALHIPRPDLLDLPETEAFKNAIKDGSLVVLYGADGLDATGPGMLLRDLGHDHVRILLGGYSYYMDPAPVSDSLPPAYLTEAPKYDFAKMAASPVRAEKAATPAPELVLPVRRTGAKAEGGC